MPLPLGNGFSHRKGIESFLAAAAIILMTVVVSTLVASWLFNLSKEEAENTQASTSEQLACRYAGLYIDSVNYNCSSNCAAGTSHNLTVKAVNSGMVTLSINKVYIINTKGQLLNFTFNETKVLKAGDIKYLENISSVACTSFNNTIDSVVLNALNCTDRAHDSFPGTSVTYVSC